MRWLLLPVLGGCGGDWACVSEGWVVDGNGDPVEACVEVASRNTCEDLIGHPTFPAPCGDSFPSVVSECPGQTLTDLAKTQLLALQVLGPTAVRVPLCTPADATGGTGAGR
jgi:hypothetical protein